MAACERCPSPGACGAVCPLLRRPQVVEFGKRTQIVSTPKEISPEFKGVSYLRPDLSPVRLGGGELPTPIKESEKICSECNELASTCSHSSFNTSVLKAA